MQDRTIERNGDARIETQTERAPRIDRRVAIDRHQIVIGWTPIVDLSNEEQTEMEFTGGTSPYPASPTFVTFNPHYLNEMANESTTDANSTDWSATTVGDSAVNRTVGSSGMKSVGVFESQLIIPLYATIFLLAVVGNSLVVITLAQNKRMRTVTNVYLLNLVSFAVVFHVCNEVVPYLFYFYEIINSIELLHKFVPV